MSTITANGDELIPTREAARRAQLTPNYISRLCWAGKLEAQRLGFQYLVSVTSLENYLAQPRKPGRKRSTAA